jgi:phosphate starvation-inducible membrane PsiE
MDVKTKRTIILSIKNLCKLLCFGSIVVGYMAASIWMSVRYFGDIYIGFAAIALPFLFYAVWDQAKTCVEYEMEREQDLIRTLSKTHEQ